VSARRVHRGSAFRRIPVLALALACAPGCGGEEEDVPSPSEDVHARDAKGRTPLIWAIRHGLDDLARKLLEAGADPAARDHQEGTPLLYAAAAGNEAVAKLLVERGVDVNARNSGDTCLTAAATNGSIAVVKLLVESGANVERPTVLGKTPLMAAAFAGARGAAVARYLLDNGAAVDTRTPAGESALFFAVARANEPLVRLLLERKADPNQRTREDAAIVVGPDATWGGLTPLMVAAYVGDKRITRLLMGAGARTEPRNSEGLAALDICKRRKHAHLIAILEGREAPAEADPLDAARDAVFRGLLHLRIGESRSFGQEVSEAIRLVADEAGLEDGAALALVRGVRLYTKHLAPGIQDSTYELRQLEARLEQGRERKGAAAPWRLDDPLPDPAALEGERAATAARRLFVDVLLLWAARPREARAGVPPGGCAERVRIATACADRAGDAELLGFLLQLTSQLQRHLGPYDGKLYAAAARSLDAAAGLVRTRHGTRSPQALSVLLDAAELRAEMGDIERAERCLRPLLEIAPTDPRGFTWRGPFGIDRSGLHALHARLGDVACERGRWELAERIYRERGSQFDLARVLERKGDVLGAAALLWEPPAGAGVLIAQRGSAAHAAARNRKDDRLISLHVGQTDPPPRLARLAAAAVLRRKGVSQEFETELARLQRTDDAVGVRTVVRRLRSLRGELATLAVRVDPDAGRIQHLEQEIAQLEETLGKELWDRASDTQGIVAYRELEPPPAARVQAELPDGSVLVEFVRFRPFHAAATGDVPERGKARYAAYVFQPKAGPPRAVDLGRC